MNSITALHDLTDKVEFLNCRSYYTKNMVEQQLSILAKMHGKNWLSKNPDVLERISFRQCFVGLDLTTKAAEACASGFQVSHKLITSS